MNIPWRIVLNIAGALAFVSFAFPAREGRAQQGDLCPPPGQCWSTQDVNDPHVDFPARKALREMMIRGGAEGADASSMLCAVKRGELEGIYLPDKGVPALRARGVGSNWWEMIPKGSNSACYRLPADRPPLIVFRKQIKDNPSAVAAALREVWEDCGTITVARCYTPTAQGPSGSPLGGMWERAGDYEEVPGDPKKCRQRWTCRLPVFASENPSEVSGRDPAVKSKTPDKITTGRLLKVPVTPLAICSATIPKEPCEIKVNAP